MFGETKAFCLRNVPVNFSRVAVCCCFQICTPWKQVTGLSKERTAKIIPNAMSYSTDTEQYYFTSFGQRDKTFTTLYRIWQGAVRDQVLSSLINCLYNRRICLTLLLANELGGNVVIRPLSVR